MPERAVAKVLRTIEELEALALAWSALWRNDPNATPFQSPEWLLPWWHEFGQPDLRAVLISRGETPVGLLPFYLYREPGAHERRLLPIGISTTDYLAGIYSPACSDEDIQAGLNALLADTHWDRMIVTQLRPGARILRVLDRLKVPAQVFETEGCSRTPAMRMGELPQKIRRNAMYYRNRARRRGELELTVADRSNWREAFDALVRLHADRWQTRGEPGVLADERVVAMHREAIPLLLRAGTLRLCCLRLNSEIIGVLYSLIDPAELAERTQYFYLPAFAPEYAELRSGTVMTALAMERAVDEGVRWIDMLRGDEPYKQIWHLERTPTIGFELHRNGHTAIGAVA
jgi:CelD/BcsL family acetyltransferase involved in cellulose biosynthesis